jgi:hypothetical protein
MTMEGCTVINGLNPVTIFSFIEKIVIDHVVYGGRHIQK